MREYIGCSYIIGSYSFSTFNILIEIVFSVSLLLSVDSQLMLFNCSSVLSLSSIPGESG